MGKKIAIETEISKPIQSIQLQAKLPSSMRKLINEYEVSLKAAGRSLKTIISYFGILDGYFTFLITTNSLLPIPQLGRRELNAYLLHLRSCKRWPNRSPSQKDTCKLSPFTIQDHARTIKAFWGWLFRYQ